MEELSVSLAGLTKEIVAVFGCLCIVFNILLPIVTDVLRFVALEGPEEWAKWETHRTQQRELKRLERKLELLRKRDAKMDRELEGQHMTMETATEKRRTRRAKQPLSTSSRRPAHRSQSGTDDPPHSPRRLQSANGNERIDSGEASPDDRPRRHRLSIYSTVKKPRVPRDHHRSRLNSRGSEVLQ